MAEMDENISLLMKRKEEDPGNYRVLSCLTIVSEIKIGQLLGQSWQTMRRTNMIIS